MNTLSIPLTKDQRHKINFFVEQGFASSDVELARKAIDKYLNDLEKGSVFVV